MLFDNNWHLYSAASNPHIQKPICLLTESEFAVHVFCWDVEIKTIEGNKILRHVTDKNTPEILIVNMKRMEL